MSHASVHERLVKLGLSRPINKFTHNETVRLRREYQSHADAGTLDELAASMGRTKQFLCRQAHAIGLTDQSRQHPWSRVWMDMTEREARILMDQFKASSLGMRSFCQKNGLGSVGFWQTMLRYFPDEYEHVIESKVPKSTKYRLGRAFEYSVKAMMKKRGYFVLRSPASKGPVDLVALKPGSVLLIQCKRGGYLGTAEWNEFFDLAESCGATPILAGRIGYREVAMARLIGRKDGTKKAQPMEEFEP